MVEMLKGKSSNHFPKMSDSLSNGRNNIVACCAVIYLVSTQASGKYAKQLTFKSSMAKPNTSVPRLELIGAQMLSNLILNVKSSLTHDISETYRWLNSQTVLCWLENNGEWKQLVRKCVDQILDADIKCMYCPTGDNPADLGTRGTTATKLQENTKWWEGPEWLIQRENWPHQPQKLDSKEASEEIQKSTIIAGVDEVALGISNCMDICKYNSGLKLIKVTAWVLRFVENLMTKSTQKSTVLP